MAATSDAGLLAQILDTLGKLGERLAVVESDLKTVIRDHTKDLDDHEVRIRALEESARATVSREDLEAAEEKRAAALSDALVQSDRKANRRLTIASVCLTAALSVVALVLSRIT